MKIYFRLVRAFSFASLVALSASCQSQVDNRPSTKIEKSAETKAPEVTANSNVGDDRNVLIKMDGWPLPSLSSFAQTSKGTLVLKGANVEVSEYTPNGNVIQIADGNTFNDVDRIADADDKSWQIRSLKVFSVKDRPFCYLMRGNLVTLDQEARIKDRLAMSIVLVYYDRDGDGIFESFKYSPAESPPIPTWARDGR
jgi:hypothetical protein